MIAEVGVCFMCAGKGFLWVNKNAQGWQKEECKGCDGSGKLIHVPHTRRPK